MEQIKENKMGTRPMLPLIVSMSLPAMFSMLVQALYNIVDSIFVSRLGVNALAAVSLAFPVQTLMIAVAVGTGVGINSLIARRLGEHRQEEANSAASHGLFLGLFSWIPFLIFGFVGSAPFMRMFSESSEVVSMGIDYLSIVCVLSIGSFVEIACEKTLQATGNMVYPMLFQLSGAITNIILDPIFIFGLLGVPAMGVAGAAIATVFSQGVSAVWVLWFLCGKRTILKLRRRYLRLEPGIILPCLALGVSSFVMVATESILNISFNASLSRYGGDIAVGAMTIITSVNQLISMPVSGVCQGGQPLISYNYGAGQKKRVKEAFRCQFITCVVYAVGFWALVMLVPQLFARVFSNDTELISYTVWAMRIYMLGIFSTGFQVACQQSFVALGQAKVSLLLACLRKLILLIPLIFILPQFMPNKVLAVFLAEPISDILAAIVTVITFLTRFDRILAHGPSSAAIHDEEAHG